MTKGDDLFQWDPYSGAVLSKVKGTIQYKDIVAGITLMEDVDEQSGRRQSFIKESTDKNLHPTIQVSDAKGQKLEDYPALKRWFDAINARPAVQKGLELMKDKVRTGPMSQQAKEVMFGATQYQKR